MMAGRDPFDDIIRQMADDEDVTPDEFAKKIDNIEAFKEIQSYKDKIQKFKDAIDVCEQRISEILKSLERKR